MITAGVVAIWLIRIKPFSAEEVADILNTITRTKKAVNGRKAAAMNFIHFILEILTPDTH